MSKDTGYKLLKKACDFNFLKWGEHMKRAQLAERKCEKLKMLILYTDPILGNEQCGGEIQLKQWLEFIKCFPDEAK